MAAAAPPPWVILRRILRRKDEADAERSSPAAVSTVLRGPPQVTILFVAVAPHNHPGRRIRSDDLAYLVAAAPSALLLCFCPGSVPAVTDGLIVARSFVAPANARRQPTTGSTDLVPARTGPSMPATYDIRSVGLIPRAFGGGYVVAELQVTRRRNRAKLFRVVSHNELWSTPGRLFHDREWSQMELDYPLSAAERQWHSNGVVAHADKLWWFDLSWGLLSCNPGNVLLQPVLSFHDLPPGCYLSENRPFIQANRCICVSENKLRYVETTFDTRPIPGKMKVVMWTYDPSGGGGGGGDGADGWEWQKSYETYFKDIWNDGSYEATGLGERVPQIVLVSPRNHNVVYFFRDEVFFSVDVPSHQVLDFVKNCRELDNVICRHCVFPWDLPSSIANAIVPLPEQGESPSTSQGSRG